MQKRVPPAAAPKAAPRRPPPRTARRTPARKPAMQPAQRLPPGARAPAASGAKQHGAEAGAGAGSGAAISSSKMPPTVYRVANRDHWKDKGIPKCLVLNLRVSTLFLAFYVGLAVDAWGAVWYLLEPVLTKEENTFGFVVDTTLNAKGFHYSTIVVMLMLAPVEVLVAFCAHYRRAAPILPAWLFIAPGRVFVSICMVAWLVGLASQENRPMWSPYFFVAVICHEIVGYFLVVSTIRYYLFLRPLKEPTSASASGARTGAQKSKIAGTKSKSKVT